MTGRATSVLLTLALSLATGVQAGQDGICNPNPFVIPGSTPEGTTSTITVPCGSSEIIADLDVLVQIQHTWVGDLTVRLTKVGGPSELIIDRPGVPDSVFGCSGDNIDAILSDESATAVEDECVRGVGAIQGEFIPGDPPGALLESFDGLEFCGEWELHVVDIAGADIGTLMNWCLLPSNPADDDGIPAGSDSGSALMVLLLLGASAYFMRRRVAS